MTNESFLKKVLLNNKNIETIDILGVYEGSKSHIKCQCKKCGHIWFPRADQLYTNSGCPKCSSDKRKCSEEEFFLRFKANNKHADSIKILSDYNGLRKHVKCQCLVCGNEWYATPQKLLAGQGCKKCGYLEAADKTKKTEREFLEEFKRNNPNYETIEILGKYNGMNKRIPCRCKRCGNEWNPYAGNLIRKKYGCPNCSHIGTSFMEQVILFSMIRVFSKEKVIHRDRKVIGKELDIYIPEEHVAIEIGSWAWHGNKATIKKDLLKKELCNRSNIRLFIIYDYMKDRELFEREIGPYNDIFTFDIDLGSQVDLVMLKQLIVNLLKEMKKPYTFSESDWRLIIQSAREGATRMTHEQFVKELRKVNPKTKDIQIINQFVNLHSRLSCVCKICGYQWNTQASSLWSNGYGCPNCAGNAPLTNKMFLQKFKTQNIHADSIEIMSEYKGYSGKIECKCKVCGNIWFTAASHLLEGTGCSVCAKNRKLSKENFLEMFHQKNTHANEIQIIGEYKRLREKIKCKCKVCGFVWNSTPSNLLYNNSCCPLCKKKNYGSWSTKSKKDIINQWRCQKPLGTKKECHDETKISLKTIYKWWDGEQ